MAGSHGHERARGRLALAGWKRPATPTRHSPRIGGTAVAGHRDPAARQRQERWRTLGQCALHQAVCDAWIDRTFMRGWPTGGWRADSLDAYTRRLSAAGRARGTGRHAARTGPLHPCGRLGLLWAERRRRRGCRRGPAGTCDAGTPGARTTDARSGKPVGAIRSRNGDDRTRGPRRQWPNR
jgi:hypothetical protein